MKPRMNVNTWKSAVQRDTKPVGEFFQPYEEERKKDF